MKKISKILSLILLSFVLIGSIIFILEINNSNKNYDNKDKVIKAENQKLNIDELNSDMVSFDKVYIPALSYTSLEKINESKKAMILLTENWNKFKTKYYNANPKDLKWNNDLNQIDSLINNANKVVNSGNNIIDAHQKYLEDIRIIFMDLRERNNINNYYIDYLTKFHKPMEDIVLAAKGKDISNISLKEITLIKNTLPEAKEKFNILNNANLDTKLFGFNSEKMQVINSLKLKEISSLNQLQKAVDENNTEDIIKYAVLIKPNFAKLFMQFGEFQK